MYFFIHACTLSKLTFWIHDLQSYIMTFKSSLRDVWIALTMIKTFIILKLLLISSNSQRPKPVPGYEIEEELYYDTFPDEFIWGAATAAYQVKKV